MHIDKNSYGTIALVYLISAAVVTTCFCIGICIWVRWAVLVFALVFCTWQTLFFRVPVREIMGSDTKISAVADGKIVIIEKAFEKEFLKCDCIQISTYMDFFDVHANFWPVSGTVTYYKYHPGKHFLAFLPKASDDNEHSCTCIRTDNGKDVFFKQIAGTFARRIVCYSKVGDKVRAGEQCGIIKFGSRIDLFIPLDSQVMTNLGEFPRACESILASLD